MATSSLSPGWAASSLSVARQVEAQPDSLLFCAASAWIRWDQPGSLALVNITFGLDSGLKMASQSTSVKSRFVC